MIQLMSLLSSKLFLVVLASLGIVGTLYTSYENHKLTKLLNECKSTSVELSKSLDFMKEKEIAREIEIKKWKQESDKKLVEMSTVSSQRIKEEKELALKSIEKWSNQKFTKNCSSNIDILRNHALSLQESRK